MRTVLLIECLVGPKVLCPAVQEDNMYKGFPKAQSAASAVGQSTLCGLKSRVIRR